MALWLLNHCLTFITVISLSNSSAQCFFHYTCLICLLCLPTYYPLPLTVPSFLLPCLFSNLLCHSSSFTFFLLLHLILSTVFSLPSFHLISSLSFSPSLFIVTCLCKTAVTEINYHCARLAIFGLMTRLMPVERLLYSNLLTYVLATMFWQLWRSCSSVNKKSSMEIICVLPFLLVHPWCELKV